MVPDQVELGFDRASVGEVARRAGVNRGVRIYHFAGLRFGGQALAVQTFAEEHVMRFTRRGRVSMFGA